MDITIAILLGIIQGVTEWLPVSSEGTISLVMVNFLGETLKDAVLYSVWLHLGTLLAAVVYFRKELKGILSDIRGELSRFLIISTFFSAMVAVPAVLLGIDNLAFGGAEATALIGIFLVLTGGLQMKARKGLRERPSGKDAIVSGILQGISPIPGISRSGITASSLLLMKHTGKSALKLSFLMSIPFIAIAEAGMIASGEIALDASAFASAGFAFIFGLGTIKCLMGFAEKLNFGPFCVLFGILAILSALI